MEFSWRSIYYVLILCSFLTLSPSVCDKIHERGGSIARKEIHVALILDMESLAGRVVNSCISIAVSDFYSSNANYKTRLVLHARDSKGDALHTLSQVSLLMDSVKLEAIVVGDTSSRVELLAELGGRAHVPVLSLSYVSPSLPSSEFPYLIQIKEDENHQVSGITSIIETFNWMDIILIYEDDSYGRAFLSNMMSSAQELMVRVSHTIAIPTSSTYAKINEQLKKLITLQTTVFVVHLSSFDLASQVFLNAQNRGLLTEGYVWITTNLIMNYLSLMNSSVLEAMQGVVGFKSYFPASNQLSKFNSRWRRGFLIQNQDVEVLEPSIYGLWMYDTMRALALATERMAARPYNEDNHEARGFVFFNEILHSKFTGMSGEFQLRNGSLLNRRFEIVNIMRNGGRRVGYWSPESGITSVLSGVRDSNSARKLETVVWPGGSVKVPTGWTLRGKKLRVGVPANIGFNQLISLSRDASTNATVVTGFCIDVFRAALETLDYEVPYELIPFEDADGQMAGSYTDLINQVVLQRYDAVVGDTTITYNRSAYVDFTVPYTDLGIGMVARKSDNNNMWVFLKPLTKDLWIITAAFFVFTGFVIWLIERPNNEEFRPVSMILWYSLSTLVFAHRKKLVSNLSNFVVAVWVFFVLVLSSSYTATLASMFTVQQIHLSKGDYIGYPSAATVSNINFADSRLKPFTSLVEMSDALSRGSKNGGVSAIIEEIPYLELFLAQYYSAGYTMIIQEPYTNGFGFVFSKGSPLVGSMSRAILKLREEKKLKMLEDEWFKSGSESNAGLLDSSTTGGSSSLNLANFGGLFLITGVSSTSALIIFSVACLYRKFKHNLGLYTRCVDLVKMYLKDLPGMR